MVCVSFCVICIAERLVSSVICRFQGLSYSHVPECIEFSFILFIHHNIHFYFELCTYCNILDIYLSWNMNSVKYLFIWNYWIIYFVTCLSNMDYFQIMLFTVTCWKFQKIQQPYIKRYFYVFFSTNIVEILLKLWADASSGSGAVMAFLQGSSSPSPSPSPSSSLLFSIFA